MKKTILLLNLIFSPDLRKVKNIILLLQFTVNSLLCYNKHSMSYIFFYKYENSLKIY
jgi:hypothetical protein